MTLEQAIQAISKQCEKEARYIEKHFSGNTYTDRMIRARYIGPVQSTTKQGGRKQ